MKAAQKESADVIIGTDQTLVALPKGGTFVVDFADLEMGLRQIMAHCTQYPVDGVIGVDESTLTLAARAAKALGLAGNDDDAVACAVNKLEFRRALKEAGLPVPEFKHIPAAMPIAEAARGLPYPCVLKPTGLSASRGVIRADNQGEAEEAIRRIRDILDTPGADGAPARDKDIIAESFIPGAEFALEGILDNGQLTKLALFEKPDPLDGPFFEETIYLTPPRLSDARQADILRAVQSAAGALGLTEGPVHAELRLDLDAPSGDNQGPAMIELAPRTIGGHCGRSLNFASGQSLEEVVVRHALGLRYETEASGDASGVMMIPIAKGGTLRHVGGLEAARATPHITEVTISIAIGGDVIPWPEGFRYLGFIFARAADTGKVETALRQAHAALDFDIG
jgi:biotin carboxylase